MAFLAERVNSVFIGNEFDPFGIELSYFCRPGTFQSRRHYLRLVAGTTLRPKQKSGSLSITFPRIGFRGDKLVCTLTVRYLRPYRGTLGKITKAHNIFLPL